VSGDTPLSKRDKLQQALGLLEPGDILLVAKWDRIARGIEEAYAIQYQVKTAGAKLVSCDGVVNEHDADDTMSADIRQFMFTFAAKVEKQRIKERTSETLRLKASRGEVTGRTPYGYHSPKDGSKYRVADTTEQAMIEAIRQYRAQGFTMRAIVDALAEQGYRTRKGSMLQLTQVARIMQHNGIA
jgi:DNA invertase Pin-like site-specific DNA recombinase